MPKPKPKSKTTPGGDSRRSRGLVSLQIDVTPEQRLVIQSAAQFAGYSSPREYILSVIVPHADKTIQEWAKKILEKS